MCVSQFEVERFGCILAGAITLSQYGADIFDATQPALIQVHYGIDVELVDQIANVFRHGVDLGHARCSGDVLDVPVGFGHFTPSDRF